VGRESDFRRSRKRLMETPDFAELVNGGHQLIDGVVLTSISDKPVEMSFKCSSCGGVYWFRNLTAERGTARWRFSSDFSSANVGACVLERIDWGKCQQFG
jgi:hypothetical protein